MDKLIEAKEIKLTKHLDYPDVVKGYFYRRNYDVRGFRHPLCVYFTAASADNLPYPFETKRVNDQNVRPGSRLNFLTAADADKWGEGDNTFLSNKETTAVRIDINGDIPCYADIDWVEKFAGKRLNPIIAERMKKAPVDNPFGSEEDKQKRAKVSDARSEFIQRLKDNYDAQEDTNPENKDCYLIPISKLAPQSVFNKAPYTASVLGIKVNKNGWKFYSPDWHGWKYSTKDKNLVFPEDVIDTFEKVNAIKSYEVRDLFQKGLSALDPDNYIYLHSENIEFYIDKKHGWAFTLYFDDLKDDNLIYTLKCSYGSNVSQTGFNIDTFDKKASEWKEYFMLNFSITLAITNFIRGSDIKAFMEDIHIKIDDIKTNKAPAKSNERLMSKETKDEIADILMHDFETDLRQNNMPAIIEKIKKESSTSFVFSKASISLGNLYIFFREEFNIDLIKEYAKNIFLSHASLLISYTLKSEDIILTKETFDLKSYFNFYANNDITVEEGVKEWGKIVLVNHSGDNSIMVTLPSTLSGSFNHADLVNFYYKITPIKDEHGELISPFTINRALFEKYKDHFIV